MHTARHATRALALALLLAALVAPAGAAPSAAARARGEGVMGRDGVTVVGRQAEEEEAVEAKKPAPVKKPVAVAVEEEAEEAVVVTKKKTAAVATKKKTAAVADEADDEEEVAADEEEEAPTKKKTTTKKVPLTAAAKRAAAKAKADAEEEDEEEGTVKRGTKVDPTPPKPRPLILNEKESDVSGNVFTPASAGDGDVEEEKCFEEGAVVILEGGVRKIMKEVEVGDRVMVGGGRFSEVFMFTHRVKDGVREFVRIQVASGEVVKATAGHYFPVQGKGMVAAGEVVVGDVMRLMDGGVGSVVGVAKVTGVGLYNPQTVDGEIVVDGVVASCYTMAVEPTVAHVLLVPFRAAWRALGCGVAWLEEGGKGWERFAVGGGKVEL